MEVTRQPLKRIDISLLFRRGKRVETPLFSFIVRKNDISRTRFIFVVSRMVSKKAVMRNTLRRRIREWFRAHQSELHFNGYDIGVILKKEGAIASRHELYDTLEAVVKKYESF